MSKIGYVYIITNQKNGTLYTGVTSNIKRRAYEHKEGSVEGFSKKYGLKKLVFVETFSTMIEAIEAEKKIKSGSRAKKLALIESINPNWDDLYPTL